MSRPRNPRIPPGKFSQSGPGRLLVPSRPNVNSSETDAYPFIGVSIAYTNLFGGTARLQDVIDRLSHYGLKQILDVVSRISAVLHHFGYPQKMEAQKIIRDIVFGTRAAEINDAIRQWFARQDGTTAPFFLLFHELQLINTAKIALLVLPDSDAPYRQSLDKLGEALLLITDLINRDEFERPTSPESTDNHNELLYKHFVRNTLFNAGDERLHAYARAFDIFLSDHNCGVRSCKITSA
jgi:hypothetical protein